MPAARTPHRRGARRMSRAGGRRRLPATSTAPLRERTREALADAELAGNLRAAGASWAASRAGSRPRIPFAEMRDRAREIRRGDIRDLPELLDAPRGATSARPAAWWCAPPTRRRLPLHHRPRRGARRAPRGQVEVDGDGGDQAQRGHRGGGPARGGDRPRRVDPPARRPAPEPHRRARPCTSTRSRCATCSRPRAAHDAPERPRGARRPRARAAARGVRLAPTSASRASTSPWPETGTICIVENEGNARLVTALPAHPRGGDGDGARGARLGRGRAHPPDPPDGGDRRRRGRLRQPHHRPPQRPTRRTGPRSSTW